VPALNQNDFPRYNGFLDYLLRWTTMPLYGALASLFFKLPLSPYSFRFDIVTPSNPTPKEHDNGNEPEQNAKSSRKDKRW